MASDLSRDSREPLDSPWTEIANRPSPFDDYTASQEAGPMVRGVLRRFPRWGWLLLVAWLIVVPALMILLPQL